MTGREYIGKRNNPISKTQVRADLENHLTDAIIGRDHADLIRKANIEAKKILDGLTDKERDWVHAHVMREGLDQMTYGAGNYEYYLGGFGYLERLDKCWQEFNLVRVSEYGITWESQERFTGGAIMDESLNNKARAKLIKVEKKFIDDSEVKPHVR